MKLKEKLYEILENTRLNDREKQALLTMYQNLLHDVKLDLLHDMIEGDIHRILGAIYLLTVTEKIDDDEELCMLINGIEAWRYCGREGV